MLNRCLRTCLEQQKQYRGLRRGARTKNKDLGRYVFLYFEYLKSGLQKSHCVFYLKEEPIVQECAADAT
jgi:hypothetical protein